MSAPQRPLVMARATKQNKRKTIKIQRGLCDRPPVAVTGVRTLYLHTEYHNWERFDFMIAWDAVTLDTDGFAADLSHYDIEFRAANAAGTEQRFYTDPSDGSSQPARWKQHIKALTTTDTDQRLHAILKHIPRPNTWRYQARIRAIDTKGRTGGWTAWLPGATVPLATRAAQGVPPAPTALSQTLTLHENRKYPRFMSAVAFTGVPNNWTLPDGDTEDDVASYDVNWKIWIPNGTSGNLNAAITNAAVSIVLQAGQGAGMPAVPFIALIQPKDPSVSTDMKREIVRVTARSTDTLTVVRNYWASGADPWNAGDILIPMRQDQVHHGLVHDRDEQGNINQSAVWYSLPHARTGWISYRVRSRDRYNRVSPYAPDTGLTNAILAGGGADQGYSVPVQIWSHADPVPPAPTFPGTPITFHQIQRHRHHHRWTAEIQWNEVRDWVWHSGKQELEIDVHHYVVEFRRCTAGGVDAWGGKVVRFTFSADHDDDTGNVVNAPVHTAVYRQNYYQFRVRAVAQGGFHGPWSGLCSPVQCAPFAGVTPPNPASVGTELSYRHIGISWQAPADADNAAIPDKDIAYFQVQFADNSAFTTNLQDFPHITQRKHAIKVANSASKWARVRSISADGDVSAWVYHNGSTTVPGAGVVPSKTLSSSGGWTLDVDDGTYLLRHWDGASNTNFSVDNAGNVVARSVEINPKSASAIPLVVKDVAGTSANWTEWQTGAAAVRALVSSLGDFVTVGGNFDARTAIGDANPVIRIDRANKKISFGPGGAGALDIDMARTAATELTLSSDLKLLGRLFLGGSSDVRALRTAAAEITVDDGSGGAGRVVAAPGTNNTQPTSLDGVGVRVGKRVTSVAAPTRVLGLVILYHEDTGGANNLRARFPNTGDVILASGT